MVVNPTLMGWLPDPDAPPPNGDPHEPLPQPFPGEPEDPKRRPRLLDLFCGAGGAAMGYARAGFEVVGVDIRPQKNYPFEFHQADALTFPLGGFDAIHASPPCQRWANVTRWRGHKDDHPDLLSPILQRLVESGLPWVVENVPEAPMRRDLLLCGSMFGLNIKRHRQFQTSWPTFFLLPPCHHDRLLPFMHKGERAFADAMGCTWMTNLEAREAIPPVYTTLIGQFLLAQFPGAAANVGARPTTATRTNGSGGAAPRGDDAAAPVSPVEAEVSTLLGTPRRDDSPATAGASVSAPCDQLAPGVALHRKSRSGGRASSTTHEARAIFEPVARKEGQVQLVTPSRGGGGDTGDGRASGSGWSASASTLTTQGGNP